MATEGGQQPADYAVSRRVPMSARTEESNVRVYTLYTLSTLHLERCVAYMVAYCTVSVGAVSVPAPLATSFYCWPNFPVWHREACIVHKLHPPLFFFFFSSWANALRLRSPLPRGGAVRLRQAGAERQRVLRSSQIRVYTRVSLLSCFVQAFPGTYTACSLTSSQAGAKITFKFDSICV